MIQKYFVPILLTAFINISCNTPSEINNINILEIKDAFSHVEDLNEKILSGQSAEEPQLIVIGIDERNGLTIIQKKSSKCFGCIMFDEWYDIYYDDLTEEECDGEFEVSMMDYCGYVGTPTFRGCSPDTTQ
ncbi:MAG: hypothetical protein ISR83_04615 [Candidatus Marinimicrobia bacterium]|nr:hypothetical protein [Candidatus Neomarinimicrobiota bacterium]